MERAAHRRAMLDELRGAFTQLRQPLAALKEQLLVEARRGGVAQVERTFTHWWDVLVRLPHREVYARTARAVAQQRLAYLDDEIQRRYPTRTFPVSTVSVQRALHQALTRTRRSGGRAWRYTDPHWPIDRYIRARFCTTLDDWVRRAQSRAYVATLHAASGSAGFPERAPTIAKQHANIAYPFGDATDVDPIELVERALDDVVVGRGEYYAAVGLRDLTREVDMLTSRAESQRVPMIVGWQWVLSELHEEARCPTHECLTFATTDVGHPYGEGVYFDALFPESHPNCWCAMQEVWASDDDLDTPGWTPPEPDEGYADRVRALVEQFHPMLNAA